MSDKSSRGKKREISEEEIRGYIEEGFYFRIKEVNGKKYITRRRGREEKSLGRHNDEVWSMISTLTRDSADENAGKIPIEEAVEKRGKIPCEETSLIDRLRREISTSRMALMSVECEHITDGYCTYWYWESKPAFFDTFDELDGPDYSSYGLTEVVHVGEVVKRWAVKAHVTFCVNCPAYVSMRDIAFVEAFKFAEREKYALATDRSQEIS